MVIALDLNNLRNADREGLQKEIESRITKELPGVRVKIKKVNLSFENFSSPIGISVRDINISNEEEKIEIKESRLILSLTNIFSGNKTNDILKAPTI